MLEVPVDKTSHKIRDPKQIRLLFYVFLLSVEDGKREVARSEKVRF